MRAVAITPDPINPIFPISVIMNGYKSEALTLRNYQQQPRTGWLSKSFFSLCAGKPITHHKKLTRSRSSFPLSSLSPLWFGSCFAQVDGCFITFIVRVCVRVCNSLDSVWSSCLIVKSFCKLVQFQPITATRVYRKKRETVDFLQL